MEDKVSNQEAMAAAYGDLDQLGGGVEDEFLKLEGSTAVDDDLAALKAKLASSDSSSS